MIGLLPKYYWSLCVSPSVHWPVDLFMCCFKEAISPTSRSFEKLVLAPLIEVTAQTTTFGGTAICASQTASSTRERSVQDGRAEQYRHSPVESACWLNSVETLHTGQGHKSLDALCCTYLLRLSGLDNTWILPPIETLLTAKCFGYSEIILIHNPTESNIIGSQRYVLHQSAAKQLCKQQLHEVAWVSVSWTTQMCCWTTRFWYVSKQFLPLQLAVDLLVVICWITKFVLTILLPSLVHHPLLKCGRDKTSWCSNAMVLLTSLRDSV